MTKACEANHFEMVKLLVSHGYRLRSHHKDKQKKVKTDFLYPWIFWPNAVTRDRDMIDEVDELHTMRMMARPAYILSCYTTVSTRYHYIRLGYVRIDLIGLGWIKLD